MIVAIDDQLLKENINTDLINDGKKKVHNSYLGFGFIGCQPTNCRRAVDTTGYF
jgi:hypothetical protein